MEKLKNIDKKILIGSGVGLIILLLLLILFVPLLFTKGVSENYFDSYIENQSFVRSNNVLTPEVVVFTEEEDKDVTANFVNLKRNWIVGWKVDSVTTYEVLNQGQTKSVSEIVDDLTEDIKNGNIEKGDNIDVDQLSEADRDLVDQEAINYSTIAEYYDENNENVLRLKPDGDGGTYLEYNGERLTIDGYPAAPSLSYDSSVTCYNKYEKHEGPVHAHSHYSGIVYCLDLETKTEEIVYDFGQDIYLSLGVNEEYLVYSLSTGEIGVVDMSSKEKTEILSLQMFAESDPSSVLLVDENYAFIDPNDIESASENERNIIIDLSTLEYSEENP